METPRRAQRNNHLSTVQQLSTPLKIPASPFMQNLGYGTGVNVFRLIRSPKFGQLRSPLAVKRISQRARTAADGEIFNTRIQEEAEILRKLSHPNIVGFRGVTQATDGISSLALECCKTALGSILEERREEELGPLPAAETLKMVSDIAHALDYLHTEALLLHGDIKSYNVLVKGEFETCKLCDFGVSLPMDKNGLIDFAKNPKLRYVGTNLWSAPEIMDELDTIDCKADIFSFGLVIYETIALVPPHTLNLDDKSVVEEEKNKENMEDSLASNASKDDDDKGFDEGSYIERMERACGTRPPLPEAFELSEAYNRIVELFFCCTNDASEDRPMAKTIWQSLTTTAESEK